MFQFNSATQQFTAFDLYASFTELGFEYINAFYSKVARSLSDKLRHVVICLEDPYHRKSESVSQLVSFNLPLFYEKKKTDRCEEKESDRIISTHLLGLGFQRPQTLSNFLKLYL